MPHPLNELQGTLITAAQAASALLQAVFLAHHYDDKDQDRFSIPLAHLHWHDDSQYPIAFNDVEAIQNWNAAFNDDLPVPATASEGYNAHGHTGPYDGGYLPGRGVHDHRDNYHGGFAFAVWHPGTDLPQQNWAI